MKCNWIIDNILIERHDDIGFPTLAKAAEDQGHNVFITKYIPFSSRPEFDFKKLDAECPVIIYGSIQFLNQIKRCKIIQEINLPGAYFKIEELKYSNYSWRYPGLMLNDRWGMLPYGEIKRRLDEDLYNGLQPPFFKNHRMFIRPDAVTKSFAGRVIDFSSDQENHKSLSQYEKVFDEEICIFAEPIEIIAEYRHVICDHELIAQSQYKGANDIDIRADVDLECQALAKHISREEYQPDNVYVVDTALTEDGPRIIEFNAFSCSGMYGCNTNAVVKRVSEAAWKEFNITQDI
jgi:hypothetical protein